jgi:hypothetical protein
MSMDMYSIVSIHIFKFTCMFTHTRTYAEYICIYICSYVPVGKLFNLVVDTEQTGKLLLQNGGLKKRVTILPLNKINNRYVSIILMCTSYYVCMYTCAYKYIYKYVKFIYTYLYLNICAYLSMIYDMRILTI